MSETLLQIPRKTGASDRSPSTEVARYNTIGTGISQVDNNTTIWRMGENVVFNKTSINVLPEFVFYVNKPLDGDEAVEEVVDMLDNPFERYIVIVVSGAYELHRINGDRSIDHVSNLVGEYVSGVFHQGYFYYVNRLDGLSELRRLNYRRGDAASQRLLYSVAPFIKIGVYNSMIILANRYAIFNSGIGNPLEFVINSNPPEDSALSKTLKKNLGALLENSLKFIPTLAGNSIATGYASYRKSTWREDRGNYVNRTTVTTQKIKAFNALYSVNYKGLNYSNMNVLADAIKDDAINLINSSGLPSDGVEIAEFIELLNEYLDVMFNSSTPRLLSTSAAYFVRDGDPTTRSYILPEKDVFNSHGVRFPKPRDTEDYSSGWIDGNVSAPTINHRQAQSGIVGYTRSDVFKLVERYSGADASFNSEIQLRYISADSDIHIENSQSLYKDSSDIAIPITASDTASIADIYILPSINSIESFEITPSYLYAVTQNTVLKLQMSQNAANTGTLRYSATGIDVFLFNENSLTTVDDDLVGVGENGFFLITGSNNVRADISNNRIDLEFDAVRKESMTVNLVKKLGIVLFSYQDELDNNTTLVYNYRTDTWSTYTTQIDKLFNLPYSGDTFQLVGTQVRVLDYDVPSEHFTIISHPIDLDAPSRTKSLTQSNILGKGLDETSIAIRSSFDTRNFEALDLTFTPLNGNMNIMVMKTGQYMTLGFTNELDSLSNPIRVNFSLTSLELLGNVL